MSASGAGARPTSETLVGLTHLRALAIALVFLFHYRAFAHPAWIDRVGRFGWTGVDLFFVLSGFLIARQLFQSIAKTGTFSLRRFYFKRLVRIVPAYLVVLGAYALWPAIHEREALPPLWRFVTFTQNIGLDLRTSGTFSHAWSLCIEEQFYLVLPLALLASTRLRAGRGRFAWLPALLIAGCVVRGVSFARIVAPSHAAAFVWYEWIYYPTWSRLDGLLVGVAIAAADRLRPTLRAALTRHDARLLVVAVALLIGTARLFGDAQSFVGSIVAFPWIAIAYGLLLLAALAPDGLLARRAWRPTDALATLSYALYLTHKASIHLTQTLAPHRLARDGSAMFVCCLATSLVVALGLHAIVERPLLDWRDRALGRAD